MQNLKKIVLFSAIICLTIGFGIIANAQETVATDEVSATDIGVAEPTVLPDNPFYFMKDWTRGLNLAFTFDKIKKAELENKFAGERLLEIKKMTKNNADPEKIKAATEKYQQFIGKVKENIDKIKETSTNSPNVSNFLDKFTKQQVLQGKILEQLQTQVPQQVFENIKEARTQQLDKLKDVMIKLETNGKIPERLKESFKEGNIDVTDVLEKLSEKMPVEVKQQIQNVKQEVRDNINTKLVENATEKNQEKNCPQLVQPAPSFCPAGIIKVERVEGGCATGFKCLNPGETQTQAGIKQTCKEDSDCPQPKCAPATTQTNTEPSSTVVAKCIGAVSKCVEGYCRIVSDTRPETLCRELWWFDKKNNVCQQKKFCGMFMYLGLRTFSEKEDCLKALQEQGVIKNQVQTAQPVNQGNPESVLGGE